MVRHPNILEALKRLWGPSIRFDVSKLNLKAAGYGAPVEWHQDWAFYPHTNDDLAAVGIMIDDVDEENGPLLVIPGSHQGPIFDHHADGVFCGSMDPDRREVDYGQAVALTGPARSRFTMRARCTARRPTPRASRAACCCISTAPPTRGRSWPSSRISTTSAASSCAGRIRSSRAWRPCRCVCRCRRPRTRARSMRTSGRGRAAISTPPASWKGGRQLNHPPSGVP